MAGAEKMSNNQNNYPGFREFISEKQKIERTLTWRFFAASIVSFVMAMPVEQSENAAYVSPNSAEGSWAVAGLFFGALTALAATITVKRYDRLEARYYDMHPELHDPQPAEEWASPGLMAHWESVEEVLAGAR